MQVIAMPLLLETLRERAFRSRVKAHGMVGLSADTLTRLSCGRGADEATAGKLIGFAREHISPDVIGISHAGRTYYAPEVVAALAADNARLRAEVTVLRNVLRTRARIHFSSLN